MDWINIWSNAQQEMLKNWVEMTENNTKNQSEFANMWQNLAQQNVQAWTENATPTAKSVAGKMVENQQAMMNLMAMAMQSWQAMLPKIEAGEDWQAVLKRQMDTLRQDFVKTTTQGFGSMNSMSDLWQTYMGQWQGFMAPWSAAFEKGAQFNSTALSGDRESIMQLTNLYWDAYQDTFGKLLQAPGVGSNREMDEKLRRGFAAWLDVQEASYEYQVILADTWVKAFEELMQEVVANSGKAPQQMGLREFLNKWSGVADRIFKTAFASEEYISVQSKLVNMMMAYRVKQREITEVTMTALDIPTRDEVDEAHRRIYELRKELKELRADVAALKGEKPAAVAEPTETPKPRSTSTTRRKTTTENS